MTAEFDQRLAGQCAPVYERWRYDRTSLGPVSREHVLEKPLKLQASDQNSSCRNQCLYLLNDYLRHVDTENLADRFPTWNSVHFEHHLSPGD